MRTQKIAGIVVETTKFKKGDIICKKDSPFPIWFRADAYDAKHYSGRKNIYYKIILKK